MKRKAQGGHHSVQLLAAILWCVGVIPGWADTVELSGGRTLDGVIIEETEDTVVLDIGMGKMSFARDQVAAIHRSSDLENQDTRQAWNLRYISASDLPDDLRSLYGDWERLQAIRKRATQGGRTVAAAARDQARLQRAIQSTRNDYVSISDDIARTPMGKNPEAYNTKVKRNNELVAQLNRQQGAFTAGEKKLQSIREDVARYARELTRFEHQFTAAADGHQGEGADPIARAWLDRTADKLEELEHDFTRLTVPVSDSTGGTLLDVQLNGTETGRFILDTGASIVTLSETMARRLKLPYDQTNPIQLRLADGKTSEGYPVVLASVKVGEARAEQVGAVVVPNPPAPGVDGLLGMSFLGRFEMSFDPASNHLELRKLRTR